MKVIFKIEKRSTTNRAWSCSIGFSVPTSRFYGSSSGTHVQLDGAALSSEVTDGLNLGQGVTTGTASTQGHEAGSPQQKDCGLVQQQKFGVTSDSTSSSVSSSVAASELGRHFYWECTLYRISIVLYPLNSFQREYWNWRSRDLNLTPVISGSLLIQLTPDGGS